jgi:hypothetical protein
MFVIIDLKEHFLYTMLYFTVMCIIILYNYCTRYVGGWVSPAARLDVMEKRAVCCPFRESNPDYPVV